jgi:hypothetical protein
MYLTIMPFYALDHAPKKNETTKKEAKLKTCNRHMYEQQKIQRYNKEQQLSKAWRHIWQINELLEA